MSNACFLPKTIWPLLSVTSHETRSVHLVTMVKVHNVGPQFSTGLSLYPLGFTVPLPNFKSSPESPIVLCNGRMLQLPPVPILQSIWKISDEDSWLSHNRRMWGSDFGWLRLSTITILRWWIGALKKAGSYSSSTQSMQSGAGADWTCNSLIRASLLFDLHTEP